MILTIRLLRSGSSELLAIIGHDFSIFSVVSLKIVTPKKKIIVKIFFLDNFFSFFFWGRAHYVIFASFDIYCILTL